MEPSGEVGPGPTPMLVAAVPALPRGGSPAAQPAPPDTAEGAAAPGQVRALAARRP